MMKREGCRLAMGVALTLMANACSAVDSTTAEGKGGLSATGDGNAGGATTSDAASNTLAKGGGATSAGGLANVTSTSGAVSTGGASPSGGVSNTGGATISGGTNGGGGRSSQNSTSTNGPASGGRLGVGGSGASGGMTKPNNAGSGGATGTNGSSAAGGVISVGGTAGTGSSANPVGPCDIFKANGTACVAAHSTVRALLGGYSGKLYQVRRADNTTKDIATLTTGGYADGPAQDAFCSGTTCVITVVYDQSGNENHLWYQGSTVVPGSPQSSAAKADTESLTISGHKVYSLYIKPKNSYWRDGSKSGVPTGKAPEGMYMVTSGKHVNSGCCFDYGNSETTRKADAAGAMDAINFGTQCWFGGCSGAGPWVQADLEWGLFPGGSQSWNPNQKGFNSPYVTAMLKNNGTTEFALKGGNAQSGDLTTLYKGSLPNGYNPMKKQGAIVLGSGGDCCKPDGGANLSEGTFYEGAVVAGYPSDATEDAVQSNITAAGYGVVALSSFYGGETQMQAE
ncbi:MAG TPA: arabinofuranosidase catalytic domain-containing protein [Polyangiaceae bacterium]